MIYGGHKSVPPYQRPSEAMANAMAKAMAMAKAKAHHVGVLRPNVYLYVCISLSRCHCLGSELKEYSFFCSAQNANALEEMAKATPLKGTTRYDGISSERLYARE